MFESLTIPQLVRDMATGRLSAAGVVDHCLGQIRRFDDELRAWVDIDERPARSEAEQRDGEAAAGRICGPLHGVPIAIKDIVDVKGMPTLAASGLRKGHVADRDAVLVERLRSAGAIILGKTVTTEFACFDPPPTQNPYGAAHTPGGSSSGSAVAVAADMCPAAIGSQTGGSLTRPASYCGIASCKPTFGTVSTVGVVPVSFHLDHPGPMARRACDLAAVLRAMACRETADPFCHVLAGSRDLESTGDETASATGLAPAPRLGRIETFFLDGADATMRDAFGTAAETLQSAGATVVVRGLPASFDQVAAHHRLVMAVEAAAFHRRWFPAHRAQYGPNIAELLDEGRAAGAVAYATALAHRLAFRRDMLEPLAGVDALLTPATPTTAPPRRDTTGDPRFNAPFSYCGFPTVSLPCGLGDDGMPAAVQLIGRPFDDFRLLEVAAWCEERLDFDARPPLSGE